MPTLSLIAAMAKNRVIGRNNALPWHLPEDLKYFKATTLGKPILMGRKTFDSIGKPLPGRTSVVLTRNPEWSFDGCLVVPSLDAALARLADREEVLVIGGADLYQQTLPRADRLYLTEINADFEGDAWFPDFDRSQWQQISRQPHPDNGRGFSFDFVVYQRKP
jgi:dihydrofolate reductase